MASSDSAVIQNGSGSGAFDHPVYKKLSIMNGEVNRMTKQDLQDKLASLRLDTRGVKDVLKKRLKNYYKKQKLAKENIKSSTQSDVFYNYILVVDFEATCNEYNPHKFKHEIIEFPVVMIDTAKLEVVDTFHSYCQPRVHPKLSTFCTNLTGISQATVASAPLFCDVVHSVQAWLAQYNIITDRNTTYAVLSDGPWDFSRFLFGQCLLSRVKYPKWAKKWINIKKCYSNFYGTQRLNLPAMLDNLGMAFEGRHHSGLDDARNIARIVLRMLEDGAELRVNERLLPYKLQRLSEMNCVLAEVEPVSRQDAEQASCDSSEESDCDPVLLDGSGEETADVLDLEQGVSNMNLKEEGTPCNVDCFEASADLIRYYKLQKN